MKSVFVLQIPSTDIVSEAILASFHAKIFRYDDQTESVWAFDAVNILIELF